MNQNEVEDKNDADNKKNIGDDRNNVEHKKDVDDKQEVDDDKKVADDDKNKIGDDRNDAEHIKYVDDKQKIDDDKKAGDDDKNKNEHKNNDDDKNKTKNRTRHKCNICYKFYKTEKELNKHLGNNHDKINCQTCNITIRGKKYLKDHNKIFHKTGNNMKNGISKCELCNKCFITEKLLSRHIIITHKNKKEEEENIMNDITKHKCILCEYEFQNINEIVCHMKSIHENKCEYCDKQFEFISEYTKHTTNHIKNQHEKIEKSENVVEDTRKYRKENEDNGNKGIKFCNKCEYSSRNESEFVTHTKTHEIIYDCNKCLLSFDTELNLIIHKKTLHENECHLCKRKFNKTLDLKIHIKIGHNVQPCDECGNLFEDETTLQIHKLISHTKNEPTSNKNCIKISCNECNKEFNNKAEFDEHKKSNHELHTNENNDEPEKNIETDKENIQNKNVEENPNTNPTEDNTNRKISQNMKNAIKEMISDLDNEENKTTLSQETIEVLTGLLENNRMLDELCELCKEAEAKENEQINERHLKFNIKKKPGIKDLVNKWVDYTSKETQQKIRSRLGKKCELCEAINDKNKFKFENKEKLLQRLYHRSEAIKSERNTEDKKIKYKSKDLLNVDINDMIFENMTPTDAMKSLGKLGPNYRTFDRVSETATEAAIERSYTKTRWRENHKNHRKSDMGGNMKEKVVYDHEERLLDFRNLKSTDLKVNNNVIMPNPASNDYETDMASIKKALLEVIREYIKEQKELKIRPEHINLTKQQIQGLKDFKNMPNIRVAQTDKSKKVMVTSDDDYETQLNKHIDVPEITQKELREYEKDNNGTNKTLIRIFEIGDNSKNKIQTQRIAESLNSTYAHGAKFGLTFKDHKPKNEDGSMKTRPLSNCIGSISEPSSEILCEILKHFCPDDQNVLINSTEEFLEKIENFNETIAHKSNYMIDIPKEAKFVIGTMDIRGLYVYIQPKRAGEEIEKAINNSIVDVVTNNVEACKYIAVTQDNKEIKDRKLEHVIPTRISNKGPKPTMAGPEMNRIPRIPKKAKQDTNEMNPHQDEMNENEDNGQLETINEMNENEENIAIQEIENDCNNDDDERNPAEMNNSINTLTIDDNNTEIMVNDDEENSAGKDDNNSNNTLTNDDNNTEDTVDNAQNTENKEDNTETEANKQSQPEEAKTSWNQADTANDEETRKCTAWALGISVRKVLENHCFQNGRKTFHQQVNGVIGLNLMRMTAEIYILEWTKLFATLSEELIRNTDIQLRIYLIMLILQFYVDDLFGTALALPPGTVLDLKNMKLTIDPEKIESDKLIPEDRRTFQIIEDMANHIDSDLVFSCEVPSDFPNGKVPYLDTQCWVDHSNPDYPRGRILHMFFRKSMNSQVLINKGSAINTKGVRTVHTQDLIRVLRHNHYAIKLSDHNHTITEFMQILKNSGYGEKYREEILISAHLGFKKQVENHINGTRPLYRKRSYQEQERRERKESQISAWHTKYSDAKEIMQIAATKNGELKKRCEKAIAKYNDLVKLKLVERPGAKLINVIKSCTEKKTKFECINEELCMMCRSGSKGSCREKNIVYGVKCPCGACYIGETGRCGFARSAEHIAKAKSKNAKTREGSFIYQHEKAAHNGVEQEFSMEIIKKFEHDSLGRRCMEGVEIGKLDTDVKLNGKLEWRQPQNVKQQFITVVE